MNLCFIDQESKNPVGQVLRYPSRITATAMRVREEDRHPGVSRAGSRGDHISQQERRRDHRAVGRGIHWRR